MPESVPSQPESVPEAPPSAAVNAEVADERVQAALKGDFSGISALDGEKKGWGPGGPTDKQGRPDGATVYQDRYGKYDAYFIAPNSSKVYLTFDEGYENGYTTPILDTLKEKNVKAVFFITMAYAKSEPELVKRMIDEGHVIGNHSTKHLSFPTMPLVEAAQDVLKLHDYVKANFGYEMTLFRPPMGEFSEQTLALLQMIGYKSIFWSFAYRDWLVDDQPLTVEALASVVGKTIPARSCCCTRSHRQTPKSSPM
jgi:peptidoglycan-N-acetylmuramic acid deacetylase